MKNRKEMLDSEKYQKFFPIERQIEEATSQLFKLKANLKNICNLIKKEFGFDFVSISLVSVRQNIIESVIGVGSAEDWSDIAKHYLEKDKDLRDIQADVYYTKRTEIISGDDPRFDRWIYDTYNHEKFTRVFTPILLVRDPNGKLVENWFEQEECQWKVVSSQESELGCCTSLEMILPENLTVCDVIGVVEAGYENSQQEITEEKSINLAKFIGQHSLKIHQSSLLYVLEIIAESAVQIMQANFATLHFLSNRDQDKYFYQVCAGKIAHLYIKDFSPRRDGLGTLAISKQEPKWISSKYSSEDEDIKNLEINSDCVSEGTISYIAFPLIIDENRTGVLYIHYKNDYDFRSEIDFGKFYAERAVNIIANAFRFKSERDRANQLNTLHSVTQSIVNPPEDGNLLNYIAWNTLNILAADVVTIYEYFDNKFIGKPYIAGRLKEEDQIYYDVERHSVPFKVINDTKNLYLESLSENSIFQESLFANRENICSVACILLKVNNIPFGVMFINYRRSHDFYGGPHDYYHNENDCHSEEIKLIETLAFSSALAIKNQSTLSKLLRTLNEIEYQIITTLNNQDKLLKLIAEEAQKITKADVADILLFEKIDQKLVVMANHPNDLPYDPKYERLAIGKGITGWAVENRQSVIINNVDQDERYISYYQEMKSELCVPIINSDNTILGVLNVESNQVNKFNEQHKMMLENLACLTAIALHNTVTNKKLIAAEKFATFGDLYGSFCHTFNNSLLAIQRFSQKMTEESEHPLARNILGLATNIVKETITWKTRIDDELESVLVELEIFHAVSKIKFPDDIKLQINFPEQQLYVSGGKMQIREIFYNLIKNATEAIIKSQRNDGEILITGNQINLQEKNWIQIIIQDNGVGIQLDKLEEIFSNNYTTTSDDKRGYGLWWTKCYIERLGGEINAKNNDTNGASFIVFLPLFF